eukprot:scaffold139410_cov32-Tisochrysis_lutea.AAC.2
MVRPYCTPGPYLYPLIRPIHISHRPAARCEPLSPGSPASPSVTLHLVISAAAPPVVAAATARGP